MCLAIPPEVVEILENDLAVVEGDVPVSLHREEALWRMRENYWPPYLTVTRKRCSGS